MTQSTAPSPGRKALNYAEQVLEVHAVHERAVALSAELVERLEALRQHKINRRSVEDLIVDIEMEVTSDELAANPQMSAAAMDRHLKPVLRAEPRLVTARRKQHEIVSQIEEAEADVRTIEADIRIATARMTELGGYFQYLAAIKQTENTKQTGDAQ